MRLISSPTTRRDKRIAPALYFGIVGFALIAAIAGMVQRNRFEPMNIIVPLILGVVFYFVLKNMVWSFVDEVWDDGDVLIVRNRGVEEQIELANIMNVGWTTSSRPERITLTLRQPGRLGREIRFTPPRRSVFAFTKNPLVDELIDRVDAARRD